MVGRSIEEVVMTEPYLLWLSTLLPAIAVFVLRRCGVLRTC